MGKTDKPKSVIFRKQIKSLPPLSDWKKIEQAAAAEGIGIGEWLLRAAQPEIDKLTEPTAQS